jgi:cytochrome c556
MQNMPFARENKMSHFVLLPGHLLAMALGLALLIVGDCGPRSVAFGQDQSAATTKDVVFARKILMDSIGSNMDEIDTMLQTGKIDLTEGREHADTISIMLMAFPHLFPPSSDQWKPNIERDPGTDTFASPDLWKTFGDFYKLAALASKTAYNASRATDEAAFKKFGAELRATCDTCHDTYLKKE